MVNDGMFLRERQVEEKKWSSVSEQTTRCMMGKKGPCEKDRGWKVRWSAPNVVDRAQKAQHLHVRRTPLPIMRGGERMEQGATHGGMNRFPPFFRFGKVRQELAEEIQSILWC